MTHDGLPSDASPPPAPGASQGPEPASLPEPAVELEGVTQRFSGHVALDGLDLAIARGEVFGYIGPNGAGKTTTLRILATLVTPTEGRARVLGLDCRKRPGEVKRVVGYMPESFGVYENMTLLEYLEFFAAAHAVPRDRRRGVIDDVLELTDLGPKRDDLVHSFSRGMQQRACLAKTLVHDPRVLLLDEPASGLDPRARVEFRELLRELGRMGKTIVVSSHILSELATVATSVGILERGRLLRAAPVDEVLRSLRPHREFTLTLLRAEDRDRAARVLSDLAAVVSVEAPATREERTTEGSSPDSPDSPEAGRQLRIALDGPDEEVAGLWEHLAAESIRVVSLREELADLEAAFLALTRGELA